MKIAVDNKGVVKALAKEFSKRPRRIRKELRELSRATPQFMFDRTMAKMGGPGPNIVTGDYAAAFQYEAILRGDSFTAVLGNNSPQAARLEFGFYGQDSLGRNYAQAPRPHMRPALIETQEWWLEQALIILKRELG